ncbi:hypothetical protein QL285_061861 [Trifolium repens]|nr:hypothetical protein QL285_061861 [Trifolium repens]
MTIITKIIFPSFKPPPKDHFNSLHQLILSFKNVIVTFLPNRPTTHRPNQIKGISNTAAFRHRSSKVKSMGSGITRRDNRKTQPACHLIPQSRRSHRQRISVKEFPPCHKHQNTGLGPRVVSRVESNYLY